MAAWALTVVGLAVAFIALYVYAPVGAPAGYYFPRHSIIGGPDARYEGVLVEQDGCVQTETGDTVVWPPGYRFDVRDGQLVITGGGQDVILGEPVAIGGGWYDRGQIAAIAADVADVPCGESFFVSTGWAD